MLEPSLGSCQHTTCCHGDQRVHQAQCPGNTDAGGVSWHRCCVCAAWGKGPSPPQLAWSLETGKWPRMEARTAPPAEGPPRSHLSQTEVLAPCAEQCQTDPSRRAVSLWELLLTEENPGAPPHFPEPAPQPQALTSCCSGWRSCPTPSRVLCPSHVQASAIPLWPSAPGLLGPARR